jgi:hypothetical protein
MQGPRLVRLREHTCRDIIRGVGFNNNGAAEVKVSKDWGRGEQGAEVTESFVAPRISGPVPLCIFAGELGEGATDTGVAGDESPVKVGEAQERLKVLNISGSGPIADGIYFRGVHLEAMRGDDETEIPDSLGVEVTLLGVEAKSGLLEGLEDLAHVFLMRLEAVAVDENVIQVGSAKPIEKGAKGVVDEVLECRRGIGKAELHD